MKGIDDLYQDIFPCCMGIKKTASPRIFYFFYKMADRKLNRRNSLLYQSVNPLYCS